MCQRYTQTDLTSLMSRSRNPFLSTNVPPQSQFLRPNTESLSVDWPDYSIQIPDLRAFVAELKRLRQTEASRVQLNSLEDVTAQNKDAIVKILNDITDLNFPAPRAVSAPFWEWDNAERKSGAVKYFGEYPLTRGQVKFRAHPGPVTEKEREDIFFDEPPFERVGPIPNSVPQLVPAFEISGMPRPAGEEQATLVQWRRKSDGKLLNVWEPAALQQPASSKLQQPLAVTVPPVDASALSSLFPALEGDKPTPPPPSLFPIVTPMTEGALILADAEREAQIQNTKQQHQHEQEEVQEKEKHVQQQQQHAQQEKEPTPVATAENAALLLSTSASEREKREREEDEEHIRLHAHKFLQPSLSSQRSLDEPELSIEEEQEEAEESSGGGEQAQVPVSQPFTSAMLAAASAQPARAPLRSITTISDVTEATQPVVAQRRPAPANLSTAHQNDNAFAIEREFMRPASERKLTTWTIFASGSVARPLVLPHAIAPPQQQQQQQQQPVSRPVAPRKKAKKQRKRSPSPEDTSSEDEEAEVPLPRATASTATRPQTKSSRRANVIDWSQFRTAKDLDAQYRRLYAERGNCETWDAETVLRMATFLHVDLQEGGEEPAMQQPQQQQKASANVQIPSFRIIESESDNESESSSDEDEPGIDARLAPFRARGELLERARHLGINIEKSRRALCQDIATFQTQNASTSTTSVTAKTNLTDLRALARQYGITTQKTDAQLQAEIQAAVPLLRRTIQTVKPSAKRDVSLSGITTLGRDRSQRDICRDISRAALPPPRD
jgi:hypothetical protein